MILYTMMPQELIYPYDENEFKNSMSITYDGVPLMVQRTAENDYRVVRVLSSDPKHFLDSRYSPGAKISLQM
jgi:hypothetical protein